MSDSKTIWVSHWLELNHGHDYANGERLTYVAFSHVFDLCAREGLDPALVDASLTYSEIMAELGKYSMKSDITPSDDLASSDPDFQTWLNSEREDTSPVREDNYKAARVRGICPVCGQPGSGPYVKRTSNGRGRIYKKYMYFAHRTKTGVKWCYVGTTEIKLDSPRPDRS